MRYFLLVLFVLVLAACGGNNETPNPTPEPQPIPAPVPEPDPNPNPDPDPNPNPNPEPRGGTLDESFGDGGTVLLQTSEKDTFFDMDLQSDGKTVAVGIVQENDKDFLTVKRFETDGSLDSSFGTGGTVKITDNRVASFNLFNGAAAIATHPNGRICIVGTVKNVFGGFVDKKHPVIICLTSNGDFDESFDDSGKGVAFPGTDLVPGPLDLTAADIFIDPNTGEITIGGTLEKEGQDDQFWLFRISPDGFGGGFKEMNVDFGFGDNADLTSFTVLENGDMIAVGSVTFESDILRTDVALARIRKDGVVLQRKTHDFNDVGIDSLLSVTTDSQGRVVGAGRTLIDQSAFVFLTTGFVARFNTASLDLDTTFNGTGSVFVEGPDGANTDFSALAIDAQNRIVTTGSQAKVARNKLDDFLMARFLENGQLDTGFGNNGRVVTDFGGDDEAVALVLAADGKILVGGVSEQFRDDFALVRLNP